MEQLVLTYIFIITFIIKDLVMLRFIEKVLNAPKNLFKITLLSIVNISIMYLTRILVTSMSVLCFIILVMYVVEIIFLFHGNHRIKAIVALMVPLYGNLCLLLMSAFVSSITGSELHVAFADPILMLVIRILTVFFTAVFSVLLLKIEADKYFNNLIYQNPQKLIIFFVIECALIIKIFTVSLLFLPPDKGYSLIAIAFLMVMTNTVIFLTALFMLVGFDMIEDRKIQSNYKMIDGMYKSLLSENSEVMAEIDCISGKVLNYLFRGVRQDKLIGTTYEKVTQNVIEKQIHPDDKLEYLNQTSLEHIKLYLNTDVRSWSYEYRLKTDNGVYEWYHDRVMVDTDDDLNSITAVIVTTNIQNEKNLKYCASFDDLTGLYNRKSIDELITVHLKEDTTGALFIIDIDNFKAINDNLGHTVGDAVLKEVAQKLSLLFGTTDIVGRLGGDEFIAFMKTNNNVQTRAMLLCNSIKHTYSDGNCDVTISASVGICLATEDHDTFDKLYAEADKMLYVSKEQGKNTFNIV
ncbi:MAG: hypothetical protein ATN35_06310 [Epulopiscium sp. Nele67-Bin004]|nr:MAG: hypothetical protein ATN35_06310 [Epulopiscium sp. Nele67-Bin004]